MTTIFDADVPREYPLGSCIHCGQNIWRSDLIVKRGEKDNVTSWYHCKHCHMIVMKEELIPF